MEPQTGPAEGKMLSNAKVTNVPSKSGLHLISWYLFLAKGDYQQAEFCKCYSIKLYSFLSSTDKAHRSFRSSSQLTAVMKQRDLLTLVPVCTRSSKST